MCLSVAHNGSKSAWTAGWGCACLLKLNSIDLRGSSPRLDLPFLVKCATISFPPPYTCTHLKPDVNAAALHNFCSLYTHTHTHTHTYVHTCIWTAMPWLSTANCWLASQRAASDRTSLYLSTVISASAGVRDRRGSNSLPSCKCSEKGRLAQF